MKFKSRFLEIISSLLPEIAILIIGIVLLINILNLDQFKTRNIIEHDAGEYYAYLPAIFIYHDLDFKYVAKNPDKFIGKISFMKGPLERPVIKMGMGLAVVNAPFFLIAHLLTIITGGEADGYSPIYMNLLWLATLFYTLLGLYFTGRLLKKFVSGFTTTVVLLVIIFGTNLYNYTVNQPGMSHAASFAMIAIFMFISEKWVQKPDWKNCITLAVVFGLIILIRPTNAIAAIIPFFWGVKSIDTLNEKIHNLTANYKKILTMIAIVAGIFSLQMIYWKTVSGSYLFSPYSLKNESFFFSNPQIINQLFSFRNGWLIYTPAMIFAFVGIGIVFFKRKELFLPLFLFLGINIYILSSWWCWWFIGFGNRAYIDSYAIMAIPIAIALEYLVKPHRYLQIIGLLISLALIFLNLFQTKQYKTGYIHYSSMSYEAYLNSFLKTPHTAEYWDLMITPNYDAAIKGIYFHDDTYAKSTSSNKKTANNTKVICFHQNDSILVHLGSDKLVEKNLDKLKSYEYKFEGEYSFKLTPETTYLEAFNLQAAKILKLADSSMTIKASLWYLPSNSKKKRELDLLITSGKSPTGNYVVTYDKYLAGKEKGWICLTAFLEIKKIKNPEDKIKVFAWLKGTKAVYIDNFVVSIGYH